MRLIAAAALPLFIASCAPPPPAAAPGQAPRQAEELAGRTAGAPQHCALIERQEGLRVSQSDPHTLVYGTGRTVWANNLGPGCGFARGDTLVVHPIGASYCRGDIVRSFDGQSRIPGPSCALGDFVPYRR
jgi:hypothetical protein